MHAVETSVLVRYFVRDDPILSAIAVRLLDGEETLALGLVALAETAFVLTSYYKVPRADVVDQLVRLVHKSNVTIPATEKDLVVTALLGCRDSGRVSFADALIQVEAQRHGLTGVYTFDRRFPTVGVPVQVLRPDDPPR
jgi:predicted nucleic-acid-binding protein